MPDDLIQKILQAGQWAPSGGNTQRWRFLVVRDPEVKKQVQAYYSRLYDEQVGPRYASSAPPPGSDAARYQRQNAAVKYLTDHYHEAPVWIPPPPPGRGSRCNAALLIACGPLGIQPPPLHPYKPPKNAKPTNSLITPLEGFVCLRKAACGATGGVACLHCAWAPVTPDTLRIPHILLT